MKRGDYWKEVGGFGGLVWNGKSWDRFECSICAKFDGILINRIQGSLAHNLANRKNCKYFHSKDKHKNI